MSQTSPFLTILNKHRENATSARNKGDRFENLIQAYLQTDPKYTFELEHVWLWNDFPFRDDFGGNDLGIDLVAKTITNEYWAIQCKCHQETAIIDKKSVDSFLSTSGKKFKENDELIGFSNRIWVSTTNNWGTNAEETIRNQTPAVTRINLTDLENASVDWAKLDNGIFGEKALVAKKSLYPHQKTALEKTNAHFKTADRGVSDTFRVNLPRKRCNSLYLCKL